MAQVMFANSRNVSFEKAKTGKRGSRLSYTPTMQITKPETTPLLISVFFRPTLGQTVWGDGENRDYLPLLASPQTARPLRDSASCVIIL